MEYHTDDNDLTLKVIKMDLEEIVNCLNDIMDDFLKEYKEMEHELDYQKIDSIEIVQGYSEEPNESLVAKSEMDNILTATGYAKEHPQVIAKCLVESKQTVPHFYLSLECQMDSVLEARAKINKSFGDEITKISSEMKDLAKRARENALIPEEFQGGGFSISNLGMFGIKSFNAIVN